METNGRVDADIARIEGRQFDFERRISKLEQRWDEAQLRRVQFPLWLAIVMSSVMMIAIWGLQTAAAYFWGL